MVARMQIVQLTNGSPARSPGRPIDGTLDAAILTAAVRHLGEARHNPEFLDHFRQSLEELRRERRRQPLASGAQNGHLPIGLDLDAAVSLLTGSLYIRYVRTRRIPVTGLNPPSASSGPRVRSRSDDPLRVRSAWCRGRADVRGGAHTQPLVIMEQAVLAIMAVSGGSSLAVVTGPVSRG
jgi:Tetracyclin repressor-like, C-terminal domain